MPSVRMESLEGEVKNKWRTLAKQFAQFWFLCVAPVHYVLPCMFWTRLPNTPTQRISPYLSWFSLFTFPMHHPCTNLMLFCACFMQVKKYAILLLLLNPVWRSRLTPIENIISTQRIEMGSNLFPPGLANMLWNQRSYYPLFHPF